MFVSFGVSCSFAKNFALYMILRMGVAASTIGSFISSLNYGDSFFSIVGVIVTQTGEVTQGQISI